ncbi:RNA polymerase sigma factor [Actinomycetes bacterium KLBMP 9759]
MLTTEATDADVRPTSRRSSPTASHRSPPSARSRCTPHCASLCTDAGLAEAYRCHSRELTGFCRRALTDPWLAEEITQEVFVKAWRHCANFDGREQACGGSPGSAVHARLRTWLFAIARNAVIDAARRRGRRPSLASDADQPDRQAAPFDEYARFDDADFVRACLGTLSPAHRATLIAVFIDGLSYEQAAARLGIPIGTVKSRVFKALRALRATLDASQASQRFAS